jgi:hypothetical protein
MITSQTLRAIGCATLLAFVGNFGTAMAAEDLGKKACAQEAKRLCASEMRSFSRKKVEACMIVKIEQTSPVCHAAMLRIKAERAALKPK